MLHFNNDSLSDEKKRYLINAPTGTFRKVVYLLSLSCYRWSFPNNNKTLTGLTLHYMETSSIKKESSIGFEVNKVNFNCEYYNAILYTYLPENFPLLIFIDLVLTPSSKAGLKCVGFKLVE